MNPFETIKQNLNEDLHLKIPKKWKKIGDIAIMDFSELNEFERLEVAPIYAKYLKVKTVLQKNKINGELRKPDDTEILFGEDTETEITEYGVKYRMDLSKTMWSPGNTGWRSILDGPENVSDFYDFNNPKVIIDYFAGIGYFTIQLAKSYPDAKIFSMMMDSPFPLLRQAVGQAMKSFGSKTVVDEQSFQTFWRTQNIEDVLCLKSEWHQIPTWNLGPKQDKVRYVQHSGGRHFVQRA